MNRFQLRSMAMALACSVGMGPASAEPATAVVVIATIVKVIGDIFSAANSAKTQAQLQVISAQLVAIQQSLAVIDYKLDQIIKALVALQVHLDDKIDAQWRDVVVARIDGVNQHFATWTSPGYMPANFPGVPTPQETLQSLRDAVRVLRQKDSYANFFTVALAMGYERLILKMALGVRDDDADMRRGFTRYGIYFRKAASEGPDGAGQTVGTRWRAQKDESAAFNAAFAARPRPLRCETGEVWCCETSRDWWYLEKPVTVYDGDLITGFTETGRQYKFINGPGGEAKFRCQNSDRPDFKRVGACGGPPLDVGTPATSCDLDGQHQIALAQKAAVDTLAAALDALAVYAQQADVWSGTGSSPFAFPDPRSRRASDIEQVRKEFEKMRVK
jgi:hypothetical protein